MSDNQHGAYYSVRTPNGHLFSSSRATQEEVFADLAAAFGEEYADAVKADIKSMAITYGKESMGVVIPLPARRLTNGVQICPRSGKLKFAGMTPMIVYRVASIVTARPTIPLSPANRAAPSARGRRR